MEWLQKGTHEKHLSVLEFEKKERAKEVAELDSQKQEISSVVLQLGEVVSAKKQELQNVTIEKELAEEATQKATYILKDVDVKDFYRMICKNNNSEEAKRIKEIIYEKE